MSEAQISKNEKETAKPNKKSHKKILKTTQT